VEKLKITYSLLSPVITNGGYMTLDALLAGLIFDQTGDVDRAHGEIPLQNSQGLWHASAAFAEKIDTDKKGFVANLHAKHDLDLNLIAKGKDGLKPHRSLGLTRRREFGAVFNSYKLFSAPELTWYAQGDADAIGRLLKGVEFIGKRRASGFGQVGRLSIEPADLDGLVGHFGEPLRPVPQELFNGDRSSVKADAAWRPAYWHPLNRAICFVPEAL
jgi:hypothetical protein